MSDHVFRSIFFVLVKKYYRPPIFNNNKNVDIQEFNLKDRNIGKPHPHWHPCSLQKPPHLIYF